jgi:tetratricopeptide (TPR) repeat protein
MTALTIEQAVERAMQYQSAGRPLEAEALLAQVLAQSPDQPDALHGLGILRYETGDVVQAVQLIGRAVAGKPSDAAYQSNYGSVLLAAGQIDEAIAAFRAAVALKPDFADAHYNLGNALKASGQLPQAIEAYQRSVTLDPSNFEGHGNLGAALLEAGTVDLAVDAYRRALELRPHAADAHHNLGLALHRQKTFDEAIMRLRQAIALRPDYVEAYTSLGAALESKEQSDDAIAAYRQALALRPAHPEALNGLAISLQGKGRLNEAIETYRQALALRPDFPEALSSLGTALRKINRLDEAVASFERALVLRPGFMEAQTNLANTFVDVGRVDEAIALLRSALTKDPEQPDAHWSLGNALLLSGNFREGWAEHEWRRQHRRFQGRQIDQALRDWTGEDLGNRHILLHAEQGYGDAIQFVRYAPLVAQRGGRVLLGCPPEMLELLGSVPGVERIITRFEDAPRTLDLHCSLMSLPHVFGTTVQTIPARVPYLFPAQAKVEYWRERMTDERRLKVGLVWQGRAEHADDANRSIPLRRWAPLVGVDGVSFYSLQKWRPPASENQSLPELPLIDWTSDMPNFADTAAFITNLDLVIAVDTAVAHLSGALGKRTWVMIPFAPDFRWMLRREDNPWYPSMRLFRQPRRMEWDEPIQRVAAELRRTAGTST